MTKLCAEGRVRALLATGSGPDRLNAWKMVERNKKLEPIYQDQLRMTGHIRETDRHSFILLGGHLFEQIKDARNLIVIELGTFTGNYAGALKPKLQAVGLWEDDRPLRMSDLLFLHPRKEAQPVKLAMMTFWDSASWANYLLDDVERLVAALGGVPGDFMQALEVVKAFPDLQRDVMLLPFGSRKRGRPRGISVFHGDRSRRFILFDEDNQDWRNSRGNCFLFTK